MFLLVYIWILCIYFICLVSSWGFTSHTHGYSHCVSFSLCSLFLFTYFAHFFPKPVLHVCLSQQYLFLNFCSFQCDLGFERIFFPSCTFPLELVQFLKRKRSFFLLPCLVPPLYFYFELWAAPTPLKSSSPLWMDACLYCSALQ